MSDQPKGSTEETLLGLPQVPGTSQTQELANPPGADVKPPGATDPNLSPDSTTPSLAPVPSPPVTIPPPRTKTGSLRTSDTLNDAPRSRNAGVVPQVVEPKKRASRAHVVDPDETQQPGRVDPDETQEPVRRKSRVAHPVVIENAQTLEPAPRVADPAVAVPTAELRPVPQRAWTPMHIALAVSAGLVVLIVGALAWSSLTVTPPPPRPSPVRPIATPDPRLAPADEAPPTTPAEPEAPLEAPGTPVLALDSKQHVVDPYAAFLAVELAPTHKYRLALKRDDSKLGSLLARLEEGEDWGVLRRMASHAALQFGGARALRLHCEPGSGFAEGQTFPVELTDLATRETTPLPVDPTRHCWDFEVMRQMVLGEGVKKRVRVPTASTVKLGQQTPVRVAYVLEALGEPRRWKAGVLKPGESVLAEGRLARFALLDTYSGDNEGSLKLELYDGDVESSGLVTPAAESGVKIVPVK